MLTRQKRPWLPVNISSVSSTACRARLTGPTVSAAPNAAHKLVL